MTQIQNFSSTCLLFLLFLKHLAIVISVEISVGFFNQKAVCCFAGNKLQTEGTTFQMQEKGWVVTAVKGRKGRRALGAWSPGRKKDTELTCPWAGAWAEQCKDPSRVWLLPIPPPLFSHSPSLLSPGPLLPLDSKTSHSECRDTFLPHLALSLLCLEGPSPSFSSWWLFIQFTRCYRLNSPYQKLIS